MYKHICPGFSARYTGETTRDWLRRVKEHLSTIKMSHTHIYQHAQKNKSFQGKSSEINFTIIDKASTQSKLKIKEAIKRKTRKNKTH